jgi:hypothetical protein
VASSYRSARIGAIAALVAVVMYLAIADANSRDYDLSPQVLVPILLTILTLAGLEVGRNMRRGGDPEGLDGMVETLPADERLLVVGPDGLVHKRVRVGKALKTYDGSACAVKTGELKVIGRPDPKIRCPLCFRRERT